MSREIEKIEKAIKKAEKVASSNKAEKKPEVKKGAKKVIKELEVKKAELIRLEEEKEKADKEVREAKTEEAKKRAKLRALKAEKAYKKFLNVEKPVMMVCKILTTITSVTALITFFVVAHKITGTNNLFTKLNKYISSGGMKNFDNMDTENALRGLGKALGDGLNYGSKYYSVVAEDVNYFPY